MSAPDTLSPPPHLRRAVPLAFIIGGNLIPLIGVLAWGWDVFSIFVLYWLENVVIGVFMIGRILFTGLENAADFAARIFLSAFFTLHYGLFMMGHGAFVFSLFGPAGFEADNLVTDLFGTIEGLKIKWLWAALAGMAASELFQIFMTPSARPQKKGGPDMSFMAAPYGRLVLLHLTLIFGGMLTLSLGSPVWALAFLVSLKIVFETALFLWRQKNIPMGKALHKALFRRPD